MGDKRYRVGGTRGGHDQFKWDDVKSDVHRENYLGHSLLAPVGRWQRGKDLKWWNKKEEGGVDAARAQAEMEKARLKQLDEDLLNEALGLAPRTIRTPQAELSTADKKKLLEKGATADRDGADTERVSGLGAGPAKHHEHIPSLTLKERELERLKRERERKEGGLADASLVEIVDYEQEQRDQAATAAAGNAGGAGTSASRKRLREEKRAKKRERKEKKRAKKLKKKEKKRLKKAKEGEHALPAVAVSHGALARSANERIHHTERQAEERNVGSRVGGIGGREAPRRDAWGGGREASYRGRTASSDRDHRRGGDRGDVNRGRESNKARDASHGSTWGGGRSGERERLPVTRRNSRSPLASRDRTIQRRGGERGGDRDSRDRHHREERIPRRTEEAREVRGRDGGDERRRAGRAKRSRSTSSSSSSSSSRSSSGSSSSGSASNGSGSANSDASRSRSRSPRRVGIRPAASNRNGARNMHHSPPTGRGDNREAWRSPGGAARGAKHTRSRSRSPGWGHRHRGNGRETSSSHGDDNARDDRRRGREGDSRGYERHGRR